MATIRPSIEYWSCIFSRTSDMFPMDSLRSDIPDSVSSLDFLCNVVSLWFFLWIILMRIFMMTFSLQWLFSTRLACKSHHFTADIGKYSIPIEPHTSLNLMPEKASSRFLLRLSIYFAEYQYNSSIFLFVLMVYRSAGAGFPPSSLIALLLYKHISFTLNIEVC